MKLNKIQLDILNTSIKEVIKEECRDEAMQIVTLGGKECFDEFVGYYNLDQHNICCLVLDKWKETLVKRRYLIQNKDDCFGNVFKSIKMDQLK